MENGDDKKDQPENRSDDRWIGQQWWSRDSGGLEDDDGAWRLWNERNHGVDGAEHDRSGGDF